MYWLHHFHWKLGCSLDLAMSQLFEKVEPWNLHSWNHYLWLGVERMSHPTAKQHCVRNDQNTHVFKLTVLPGWIKCRTMPLNHFDQQLHKPFHQVQLVVFGGQQNYSKINFQKSWQIYPWSQHLWKTVRKTKDLLLIIFLYLSLWRPAPTAPEVTKIISKPLEFNFSSCNQIVCYMS